MPLCLLTVLFDLLLGEPPNRFHPTVWLGRLVSFLERLLYSDKTKGIALARGILLVLLTLSVAFFAAGLVEWLLKALLPKPLAYLGIAAAASLAIACRSLAGHAFPVLRSLCHLDLVQARLEVAKIVGRDTAKLSRGEVSRAGIESVAESLGDGVIAPLFWFALLGLPGIFLYRASNTMDSMVGHKDERYLYFGWAAARFDDLLNFIPSRLLALPSIYLACLVIGGWRMAYGGWEAALRCHAAHKSPNAGWYEAAFAGALGIRLGGRNYYEGEASDYPVMNPEGRQAEPRDLMLSIGIMLLSAVSAALILDLCVYLL